MISFYSFGRFLGGLIIAAIIALVLYTSTDIFHNMSQVELKHTAIITFFFVAAVTKLVERKDIRTHKSGKLTPLFKKESDISNNEAKENISTTTSSTFEERLLASGKKYKEKYEARLVHEEKEGSDNIK